MNTLSTPLSKLGAARYVTLATYRKSGVEVATPVWCAESDGELVIFSEARAGKVKRLRNSSRAKLAECTGRGRRTGEWHTAAATIIADPQDVDRALAALRAKYGWQMWLADTAAKLLGRFDARAYLSVQLE